jgi:hypothetical protein
VPTPAPTLLDLDIKKFKVKGEVKLKSEPDRQKAIKLKLKVKNNGAVPGIANVTVVGVQNGVEAFSMTIPVSSPRRNGATKLQFFFVPTMPGDILWTATIADGDPDVDVATARTEVVLKGDDDEDDDVEHDDEEEHDQEED